MNYHAFFPSSTMKQILHISSIILSFHTLVTLLMSWVSRIYSKNYTFYKEKIFFSLRSKPMQMLTRVWNGLNATSAINVSHTELVLSDTWSCTQRTTPSPVNSAARSSETEQSRRTTGVPTLASDPTCVISVAALSTHVLFGWTTPGNAISSGNRYFQ